MTDLAAAARFVHLAALVSIAGIFSFLAFVARPAYLTAQLDGRNIYPEFAAKQSYVARRWLAVALISGLIGLVLQIWYVLDAPLGQFIGLRELETFITQTRFGKVWLLRMALLLVVTGWLWHAVRRPIDHAPAFLVTGFTLAASVLAVSALSGHAASGEGFSLALHVTADFLHLLACAIWLGGLAAFAALLQSCRRNASASFQRIAAAATIRFSRLSLFSVVALIITGVYNAWTLVGGIAPLFATGYGKLLLLKIALLVPMLGFGAMNLLVLKPRIAAAAQLTNTPVDDTLRRLVRNVHIEALLGLGILLVVGHMGLSTPARHAEPDWPFSFRWDFGGAGRTPESQTKIGQAMALAVIGSAALLYAAFRKRRRKLAGFASMGALVGAAVIAVPAISVDAYPTTFKRPAVAYQATSIANGKLLYANSGCAACHGSGGYGNGPDAGQLLPRPADLTAPHTNSHTAGDLFWWISYGIKGSAMPGFGARLNEEDRWDLINFLRALSDSEKARAMGPDVEKDPWLVAPDFTYDRGDAGTRALKDLRGNAAVLLVLPGPRDASDRLEQLAASSSMLRAAGLEIVFVANSSTLTGQRYSTFVAREGSGEISDTYALFARSALDEELLAGLVHAEFLIDRQGYIRSRWLASEGDAWNDPRDLAALADILQKEKPGAPAPDWHGH